MKTTPVEQVLNNNNSVEGFVNTFFWIFILIFIVVFSRIWSDLIYEYIGRFFGRVDKLYLGIGSFILLFFFVQYYDIDIERKKIVMN